ncbi:unnamed protein product [Ambrosiozyma monospora]|uniref:Unnamed protein product n=1 Tax=Ambrosiozyma monospora TaxID=43982 RepID=A0ACB5SVL4_AMBMO|nr:unnamed protein product [Ambrosiozyma monospora]
MSNSMGIPQRPSTLPPTPAMLLNNQPLSFPSNDSNTMTMNINMNIKGNNNNGPNSAMNNAISLPQQPPPMLPMLQPNSIVNPLLQQQQHQHQQSHSQQHQEPEKQIFNFEPHLRRQFGFGLNPDRPICEYWQQSGGKSCPNGSDCPNKHPSKIFQNKIVCKYWLRGLCKMGDNCDFLHEYNLSRMPECAYYTMNGVCMQGPECVYLHVDPQSKIPECYNYTNLGFCPDGPNCQRRHIRKAMCPMFLTGFCPNGPKCELGAHPKFKLGLIQGQLKFKIYTDEQIIEARKKKLAELKKQIAEEEEKKKNGESDVADEPNAADNEGSGENIDGDNKMDENAESGTGTSSSTI